MRVVRGSGMRRSRTNIDQPGGALQAAATFSVLVVLIAPMVGVANLARAFPPLQVAGLFVAARVVNAVMRRLRPGVERDTEHPFRQPAVDRRWG
ncbi:hypothetical protein [Streptomyces sp. NPDC054783]